MADSIVSEVIQTKIKNGRYENHEAKTIQRIVDGYEVVLELGAGVGVISTLAWITGKVREVHCYEADPRLIPLIKKTHEKNDVRGFVYNEILSSDPEVLAAGSMDFYVREHFYDSSAFNTSSGECKDTIKVPVTSITKVIEDIKPTIIVCDIEGSELGLFDSVLMPTVKKIMLETHQSVIKGEGMRQVFHELHKADFHYDERFSHGSVSVFSRIE